MEPEGIIVGVDGLARCWWSDGDPLYRAYHDTEWGRPVADDRRLFEKLCLEGFQSGLSWLTILRKRPNFRSAFMESVGLVNDHLGGCHVHREVEAERTAFVRPDPGT